jgi:hypothetical protein
MGLTALYAAAILIYDPSTTTLHPVTSLDPFIVVVGEAKFKQLFMFRYFYIVINIINNKKSEEKNDM